MDRFPNSNTGARVPSAAEGRHRPPPRSVEPGTGRDRLAALLGALPRILAVTVAIGLLDVLVVRSLDELMARLGGLVGLELGLAIFLNAVGLLFVVDALEDVLRVPGLRWFYDLPIARSRRRTAFVSLVPEQFGLGRWIELARRVALLTVLFFLMETVLFPLFAGLEVQYEGFLVVAGVVLQLVPAWRRKMTLERA